MVEAPSLIDWHSRTSTVGIPIQVYYDVSVRNTRNLLRPTTLLIPWSPRRSRPIFNWYQHTCATFLKFMDIHRYGRVHEILALLDIFIRDDDHSMALDIAAYMVKDAVHGGNTIGQVGGGALDAEGEEDKRVQSSEIHDVEGCGPKTVAGSLNLTVSSEGIDGNVRY